MIPSLIVSFESSVRQDTKEKETTSVFIINI